MKPKYRILQKGWNYKVQEAVNFGPITLWFDSYNDGAVGSSQATFRSFTAANSWVAQQLSDIPPQDTPVRWTEMRRFY